jgi:eukaryotic-like serine/threonine-protein kinase
MEAKSEPSHEISHATPAKAPAVGIPLAVPFSPGDVIADKYEMIKVIGAGGMGYVVSATHVELGHQVALKFLRPELLVHRDLVARFVKEARTAVMIKSEHVARVFDVGTLPDAGPFIAMELLEGQDLGRVVSQRGALPIGAAIDYILQACEALATAHALGIVHRDIKPENLFLSRSVPGVDVIKVLDFGISKLGVPEPPPPQRSRRPTVRSTGAVGSPTYMSPEQIRAVDDVDARADVWALGCVLYELLTGTPAFDAPSLTQLAAHILERQPEPLRSIKPDLPLDLEWVVSHCLGKDPARRFQNVGELAAALVPFGAPSARIVADRCRYVLDPTASFEIDEKTGPVSWNGLTTGLEGSSILPPPPRSSTPSTMERVTVVARRVVRQKKPLAPIVAVAVLGMTAGLWRALSSDGKASVTASQTFLTAPGPAAAPSISEMFELAASSAAAPSDTAATLGVDAVPFVPEATAIAVPEPEAPSGAKAAARRAAPPPARPKPSASSTANEPDVGF